MLQEDNNYRGIADVVEGTFLITASTIKAGQITVGIFGKLLDVFRMQQVFRIERYGANYRKEKFLWWTTLEEGEKLIIELKGKPAFCQAILRHLENHPLTLNTGATLPSVPIGEHHIKKIN